MDIPLSLIAHEAVHQGQQTAFEGGIEGWWKTYCLDGPFRLQQEIPAHRAELRSLLERSSNRHARRTYLKMVATRLASPLYGRLVTLGEAKALLKA